MPKKRSLENLTNHRHNMTQKRGPWSREEKQFVSEQAGKMKPEDIAKYLKRSRVRVRKYMYDNDLMKYYTFIQIKEKDLSDLSKTEHWETLQGQFTKQELDSFKYHWKTSIKQFRDDILHTEEIQLIDVIKLEIMMNRILAQSVDVKNRIESFEKIIKDEKKKALPDIDTIRNYEAQIASLYAAVDSSSKEYREILKEKNNILKTLKATRESRVKLVENSKESMAGWYKNLVNNPRMRQEMGLFIEKNRIAAKVEYQRLSELHTYADGVVDSPILSAESMIERERVHKIKLEMENKMLHNDVILSKVPVKIEDEEIIKIEIPAENQVIHNIDDFNQFDQELDNLTPKELEDLEDLELEYEDEEGDEGQEDILETENNDT